MTAAGAQRVADARDGKRPVARHLIHASVELRGHRAGEINCLPDLHQLTRRTQLSDDPARNPHPRGDPLDARRLGSGFTQPRHEPRHALAHLGVEHHGLVLGQAQPVAAPHKLPGRDERVDDCQQLPIAQLSQGARAPVTCGQPLAGIVA